MAASTPSVERIADHFITYLFDTYKGSRHVRRVAAWVGFLLKAVAKVAPKSIRLSRQRQIVFGYRERRFKVRYNHRTGKRGGIQVVEVLPGRGAPDGDVLVQVRSLDEAEAVYFSLKRHLDVFIDGNQG